MSTLPSGNTAFHAFHYSAGKMTDIGTLGGTYSEATSLNAAGQIVGWSDTSRDAERHAFLYSEGEAMDLIDLIEPSSGWIFNGWNSGLYINNTGDISITGLNAAGQYHAVLLTPISFDIPEPTTLALLSLGSTALLRSRWHR